ncbi:MAG: ASPIC/UnbV domain-containing protein, partial [Acidobacteriales bacterium]|nr:ASPIC/UnbV domain-containing protein [Terriglobales bacterium]
PLLFLNHEGKSFELAPAVKGSGLAEVLEGRGAAFGDLFNNGKMDVVINQLDGPAVLLRNVSADHNHWVGVKLIGSGTKSPRDAVGAKVFVTANGIRQRADVISGGSFVSQNDMRLHFGLGAATSVEKMEVVWPSGAKQSIAPPQVDRYITVEEGKGILPEKPAEAHGRKR